MFEKYINYLKDNPNNYWFKRKMYGWGWVPVKWQGWAIIAILLALITADAFILDSNPLPSNTQITLYFVKIILNVSALLLICYKTGEKPKWQWNGK